MTSSTIHIIIQLKKTETIHSKWGRKQYFIHGNKVSNKFA